MKTQKTYHQASACSEHEHRPGSVQSALLIKAMVVRARHEDVGDAQAQTAGEEVEQRAAEWDTGLRGTLDGVARKRLVRTVVYLSPLRCTR